MNPAGVQFLETTLGFASKFQRQEQLFESSSLHNNLSFGFMICWKLDPATFINVRCRRLHISISNGIKPKILKWGDFCQLDYMVFMGSNIDVKLDLSTKLNYVIQAEYLIKDQI